MSWVDQYLQQRAKEDEMKYKGVGSQEQDAPDYASFQSKPMAQEAPIQSQEQGINSGKVATDAASGAAIGGPAGAGIAAGGSLLTQYLANKAASERARRDRSAQIEQQYAQNQNQGYQTFFNALQGAYR